MTGLAVGLDLSLTATGIATISGTLRTIRSEPDDGLIRSRSRRIHTMANRIVDEACPLGSPDMVVVEAPAYNQQGSGGGHHLRAGLWWLVVDTILDLHPRTEVVEVAPSALKKVATGRGNATKADMRMAYYLRTGTDCRDDNQVDAWWLRQIGLHLLGNPNAVRLPKTHLSGLAKIRRDQP